MEIVIKTLIECVGKRTRLHLKKYEENKKQYCNIEIQYSIASREE